MTPPATRFDVEANLRDIAEDDALLREFQEAVDRSVTYGIVSRRFDVRQAIDTSLTPPAQG